METGNVYSATNYILWFILKNINHKTLLVTVTKFAICIYYSRLVKTKPLPRNARINSSVLPGTCRRANLLTCQTVPAPLPPVLQPTPYSVLLSSKKVEISSTPNKDDLFFHYNAIRGQYLGVNLNPLIRAEKHACGVLATSTFLHILITWCHSGLFEHPYYCLVVLPLMECPLSWVFLHRSKL